MAIVHLLMWWGVVDKVEKKVDIHLLSHCSFEGPKCLEVYYVLSFTKFGMKIGGVWYHVFVFSKSPLFLELKL